MSDYRLNNCSSNPIRVRNLPLIQTGSDIQIYGGQSLKLFNDLLPEPRVRIGVVYVHFLYDSFKDHGICVIHTSRLSRLWVSD
jgi:hypothetical protein